VGACCSPETGSWAQHSVGTRAHGTGQQQLQVQLAGSQCSLLRCNFCGAWEQSWCLVGCVGGCRRRHPAACPFVSALPFAERHGHQANRCQGSTSRRLLWFSLGLRVPRAGLSACWRWLAAWHGGWLPDPQCPSWTCQQLHGAMVWCPSDGCACSALLLHERALGHIECTLHGVQLCYT
jgi:hypothetical protein